MTRPTIGFIGDMSSYVMIYFYTPGNISNKHITVGTRPATQDSLRFQNPGDAPKHGFPDSKTYPNLGESGHTVTIP
jgi:hypothetical protein